VESISPFVSHIVSLLGVWGAGATLLCAVLFLWQLFYWLARYNRIPSWRERRAASEYERITPVSVVAILCEDYPYLEQTLPLLLSQDHPDFEVVLVYVGADADFRDTLDRLAQDDPRITVTQFNSDSPFAISNKIAYNLGIKAARHPNVLLATDDTTPASDNWLRLMSKGFSGSEVVIGYCGVAPGKGWANRVMRADRLMLSVRFLSAAMRGHPYRGMLGNVAFTGRLYFGSRGFTHLNMNIGEDDLYIQSIATGDNTSVIISPACTVRQHFTGGLKYWRTMRAFYANAIHFYPRRVKVRLVMEPATRAAFVLAAVAAATVLPGWMKAIPAGMVVVRFALAWNVLRRISRRLGESGLKMALLFGDIVGPATEAGVWLRRKLGRDEGVWR